MTDADKRRLKEIDRRLSALSRAKQGTNGGDSGIDAEIDKLLVERREIHHPGDTKPPANEPPPDLPETFEHDPHADER